MRRAGRKGLLVVLATVAGSALVVVAARCGTDGREGPAGGRGAREGDRRVHARRRSA